jgi:hypothetical protein
VQYFDLESLRPVIDASMGTAEALFLGVLGTAVCRLLAPVPIRLVAQKVAGCRGFGRD